jgi:DNA-binding XRE family transcriptional regulator
MSLIDEVRARKLPPLKTRLAIRERAGVSQIRMATELGVHRTTFIRWESGAIEPRGENRQRYARLLADLQQAAR